MPFQIVRNDITKMKVDAIVSPTSSHGDFIGGTELQITAVAGKELEQERKKIGFIKETEAMITSSFNLDSKYVIHSVGPIYQMNARAHEKLYDTYMNALNLAVDYHINSIAFPLISSGTFMFPRGEALEVALRAIRDFLNDREMIIYLVIYDEASYQVSLERFITINDYLKTNDDDLIYEKMSSNMISYSDLNMRSLDDILDELDETFQQMLFRLIDERNLDDVYVYKKANIDRKLFSKIKSKEDYQPSKMTVVAFAIALELNIDQTKDLLGSAGYALSSSSKFDKIIEYFIVNESYDLYEINQVLFAFEQKTIGLD